MLGYLLFIAPMTVAFAWIARRRGVRQALLDLIAFNLLFAFDFTSLLPGNIGLSLLHVLLVLFLGVEFLSIGRSGKFTLNRRSVVILSAVAILVCWMVISAYLNRPDRWSVAGVTNTSLFIYVLPPFFMFVGIHLAKGRGFVRFAKIFLVGCALAGVVSIIQTVSGGTLLTSTTSDSYLGVFQPVGAKALEKREDFVIATNFVQTAKIIEIGDTRVFRADGTSSAAFVYLCASSAAIFSVLVSRRKKVPAILFVGFALASVGFLAAFNRSSIVAYLLVVGVTLLVRIRSVFSRTVVQRWRLPLALTALLALAAIGPIARVAAVEFDSFFGSKGEKEIGSLNGRTVLWSRVISQIQANPIIGTSEPNTPLAVGWGLDDNPDIDLTAHNSFLRYAARGGIPAGALFLTLFSFCILRALELSFSDGVPVGDRVVFLALSAGLVCVFLINMAGDWMFDVYGSGGFWVLCGYLAAYGTRVNETAHSLLRGLPELRPDAILD